MKRWASVDDATLRDVASVLAHGGVVLLPTDTIYGLHAVADDDEAVTRIASMKGRPGEKPFIILSATIDDVISLGAAVPDVLKEIWPAPLTAILKRGDGTVAVRIPDLDWLRSLLRITGPLVSTSANRSGEPAVSSPEALARDLQDSLDGLLDLGPRDGKPSAIVDFSVNEPRITREGDAAFTQNLRKTLRKTL